MSSKISLRKEIILATTALLIALGLGLASIAKFSIWHDEGYSSILIENNYSEIIERTANDVHPPFYYLLLKTWSVVFGDGVIVLRSLSLICVMLSMAIVWRLIRRAAGPTIGLAALFGMAFGPYLTRHSQEMRMYGLGALLFSASTYLWFRVITEKSWKFRKLAIAGYIALATLCLYTQYFLAFGIVAHVVFAALYSARGNYRLKNLLSGFLKTLVGYWYIWLATALLFLPWLPVTLGQFSDTHGSFWIGAIKPDTVFSSLSSYTLFRSLWEIQAWEAIWATLVGAAAAWQFYKFKTSKPFSDGEQKKALGLILACGLAVPVVLLVAISLPPFQPAYHDRYLMPFSTLFYAVVGCMVLYGWTAKDKILKLTTAILVVAFMVGQITTYRSGNNQGWRPSPHFTMNTLKGVIDSESQIGDPVYSTSLWTYFDARATLKNFRVYLLAPEGVNNKKGNASAVYGRTDLYVDKLPAETQSGGAWLIKESGSKEDPEVPANWVLISSEAYGYARLDHYSTKRP